MISSGLRGQVDAWIAEDPDPGDRAELRALLTSAGSPGEAGAAAAADLADRFAGRLEFGTAGLRGAVGAGPNRMNRAVVRAATAALAAWLAEHHPRAAADGVVVGCDARRRSREFADEAAGVLAGAGIRVHLLPRPGPTPLLAFAVRRLAAAAGIMITASHNPAADNGYKLYLADGAQLVPPVDRQLSDAIDALGPLTAVATAPAGSPLIAACGEEIAEAYLSAVASSWTAATPQAAASPVTGSAVPAAPGPVTGSAVPAAPGPLSGPAALRVVYTPLHGVAGPLLLRAVERAGFPAPDLVAAQAEPDPAFPTVAFPNPEEPGTLDLALAQAREAGADLVLANDPDGDRLAVAAPDPAAAGGWRVLTGDQVGALLGAYLLERTAHDPGPERRLVATTVVSSTLLAKIAAAAGVHYAETLTGFKWIVRAGRSLPGTRFVFGYEEALGYAVGETVRDKDGISAALAFLSLAAQARGARQSVLDRWDELERRHGVHLTAQLSVRVRSAADLMAAIRAAGPRSLAGLPVTDVADLAAGDAGLPPANVVRYRLGGARVVIRPSGTEPRLKAYLEATEPTGGGNLDSARRRATARLGALRAAVRDLIAAPG